MNRNHDGGCPTIMETAYVYCIPCLIYTNINETVLMNLSFAEEFVAHKSNVNCLAMGHKSNQVLATGGDDKKVNLWAIGRQSCLMVSPKSYQC